MTRSCRFYYEDSHRKAPRKECRLIQRNLASAPWDRKLCGSCPVPQILEGNPCANLALEGEVGSRFFILRQAKVFAVCTAQMKEVSDPRSCRQGCQLFERLG
jgi:hypothetical protein